MIEFPLVYRDGFYLPFGKAHVFPGVKYKLVRERLITTGAATDENFTASEPIELTDVLRVHEAGFVDRLINGTLSAQEIRRMELPYSKELVKATLLGCGGTLAAARLSLEHGIAVSIGGGFHHAHADHGEGFCMLHDVAIALRRLLEDGAITQTLVVDLDVHHGNGTAAIFPPDVHEANALRELLPAGTLVGSAQPSADGVFTVSMHQRTIYPAYKPPSSIDVHLEDGTSDADYMAALRRAIELAMQNFRPDVIAYVAGSDPYFDDKLGGLGLTLEGLKDRDREVFRVAQETKIPVFTVFAGGYARLLEDTVTIHTNTVLAAAEIFGRRLYAASSATSA
jgi:acetoin utilization deacetylase AcuC-like enzyme